LLTIRISSVKILRNKMKIRKIIAMPDIGNDPDYMPNVLVTEEHARDFVEQGKSKRKELKSINGFRLFKLTTDTNEITYFLTDPSGENIKLVSVVSSEKLTFACDKDVAGDALDSSLTKKPVVVQQELGRPTWITDTNEKLAIGNAMDIFFTTRLLTAKQNVICDTQQTEGGMKFWVRQLHTCCKNPLVQTYGLVTDGRTHGSPMRSTVLKVDKFSTRVSMGIFINRYFVRNSPEAKKLRVLLTRI